MRYPLADVRAQHPPARQSHQEGIVIPQNLSRAVEQLLSGLGQHHAARGTNKQAGAQLVLQLPDLHTYRRLGDVYA